MQHLSDDEIQRMLDDNFVEHNANKHVHQNDVDVYNKLYEALHTDIIEGPYYGFSNKVIAKIQSQKERKNVMMQYILLGSLMLVSFIFFINIFQLEYLEIVFNSFLKHKWIALFSISLFLLIQYLNKKQKESNVNF